MALGPLRPSDPADIGGFKISARLGAGGMGVVYLAADGAGRPVALKLVRDEIAGDPEFRARFRREVAACQAVKGQCTAAVVAWDAESDQPWLATEYVAGPSLHDLVRGDGPLTAEMLSTLALGLAEALAAIHRAGLVHRDLKPANVLISPTGPRVIDFGIAAAVDATSATRSGLVVGSPGYLAPEQVLTDVPVGPPTDVFAWALTVLYSASGKPPFGTGRPDALLYRVLHETPDTSALPDTLAPLVTAALHRDPAARPTAADLLTRLTADADDPERAATQILANAWRLPASAVAPAEPALVSIAAGATSALATAPLTDPTSHSPGPTPGYGTAAPGPSRFVPAVPPTSPPAPGRPAPTGRWLWALAVSIVVIAVIASVSIVVVRAQNNHVAKVSAPPPTQFAPTGPAGQVTTASLPSPTAVATQANGIPVTPPYHYDNATGVCAPTSANVPPMKTTSDILTSVLDYNAPVDEAQAAPIKTRDPKATTGAGSTPVLITIVTPSGHAFYDQFALQNSDWNEVYFPSDFTGEPVEPEVGSYTVIWALHTDDNLPSYFDCGGFSYSRG
ncbi:serine/threonine-protein kinase [Frankia sp. QA3]|uniref:serine/threonine protein kinase n=1 Tax=Frankia sp. QA3 TaxID=710111 RepID=UPI000269C08D|nr:serine/threonine-protein kinase [Frankia sp. QA3]EIV92747.1 protein kinase family protein [Frankia sp. QA3]